MFNQKNIELLEQEIVISEELEEIDEVEPTTTVVSQNPVSNEDRRDNYIGYLEVPDVKIKRGFVAMDSKYNSVGYNVMLIEGSEMPDVKNGNLILAAHRGNSSVSFFDKLY
ncbi:MAG: sortase, partial [Bacilli bacterium]|nr:sortase [Bacilli bacterium]